MYLIADDNTGKHLEVGVPYMFKMKAKTNGSSTLYSLKVWEQGISEPSEWTISGYGVPGELKQGSVALNSHYADVSFGNVTIKSDLNFTTPIYPSNSISSDDFNAPTLNTSLWTVVNPLNDATFTIGGSGTSGALLKISVPSGIEHQPWFGNMAPRIMQPAISKDFEIEVKFQSQLTSKYQLQGIIIQQDSDNYLRFEFHDDGQNNSIFTATFANGVPVFTKNIPISGSPSAVPLYMRVKRTGNQWEQSYSSDGVNWTTTVIFEHSLSVTSVGPFAGNAGTPSPAFTGMIDYFFNTARPIVPEDAQQAAKRSNISGYKINDKNGDGKWNIGEQGIANWKIYLKSATTGLEIANTTTDVFGLYKFANLSNGTYNVTEETKSGFKATNRTFVPVTVMGQDITNLNFTNKQVRGTIKAKVKIKPETLNLNRKGEFTVLVTLPGYYDLKNIDLDTLMCEGASAVEGKVTDKDRGTFKAKFNTQDMKDIPDGKLVKLKVRGNLISNGVLIDFEGSDTIKVRKDTR